MTAPPATPQRLRQLAAEPYLLSWSSEVRAHLRAYADLLEATKVAASSRVSELEAAFSAWQTSTPFKAGDELEPDGERFVVISSEPVP